MKTGAHIDPKYISFNQSLPRGLQSGTIRLIENLTGRIKVLRLAHKHATEPAFLTKLEEINPHMMPVAYNHEPDAIEKNIQMHKDAIAHVRGGGCLILFPAGAVARAKSWWGDAEEMEWTPFMARLILRGHAQALPMYFSTQNSRWFQMAAQFSDTARQGLLMHEIARSFGTTMRPIVGQPLPHTAFQGMGLKMPEMTRKLYEITMALAHSPDGDALPAELNLPRAAE